MEVVHCDEFLLKHDSTKIVVACVESNDDVEGKNDDGNAVDDRRDGVLFVEGESEAGFHRREYEIEDENQEQQAFPED